MIYRVNSLDGGAGQGLGLNKAVISDSPLGGMRGVLKGIYRYLVQHLRHYLLHKTAARRSYDRLFLHKRYRALAHGIPPRVWRRRSALLLMLKQQQGWVDK